MERKIGEIFDYNGVRLIVKEGRTCNGCYFSNCHRIFRNRAITGECTYVSRKDEKSIIFKEVREEIWKQEI